MRRLVWALLINLMKLKEEWIQVYIARKCALYPCRSCWYIIKEQYHEMRDDQYLGIDSMTLLKKGRTILNGSCEYDYRHPLLNKRSFPHNLESLPRSLAILIWWEIKRACRFWPGSGIQVNLVYKENKVDEENLTVSFVRMWENFIKKREGEFWMCPTSTG